MRLSARGMSLSVLGAASILVASSMPAYAFTTSSCNGKAYNYILGYFTNPGQSHVPLRCGNDSFGLLHIIKRGHLNSSTSSMIQATFTYGEQKDPGAKVLFDNACHAIYTVAYGYGAYNGTDQSANPVGIITAYPSAPILARAPKTAAPSVITPAYRRDCLFYTPIGN